MIALLAWGLYTLVVALFLAVLIVTAYLAWKEHTS